MNISMNKKIENIKRSVNENVEIYPEDWEEFERGVNYFNNAQFQHSYDAWELLWERKNATAKKFLKGLMELTSTCQSIIKPDIHQSVENNLDKAYSKLEMFLPEYFGVPVAPLLKHIEEYKEIIVKSKQNGHNKQLHTFPQIQFHKPSDPDLVVELCEIVQSSQFIEGAKLFNKGFYWEAHEAWEEMWREQNGSGKVFLETFTQIADAFCFTKLGKISSAIYLFDKSIKKLREFERIACATSLPALVESAQKTLDCLRMYSADCNPSLKLPKAPVINFTKKNN